ncbi:hypothetical protein GCM10025866_17050 [Naasia aerilata]|uniref:glucan endo-1,3-beta-D-glucosidase n=1 Tax=Naasia aerilata TaxID=1162966 RepID=A0ABM8GC26_9MICO|nr:glycosyl hydrolase [Naasia aerilata]BDZ45796.1 hypothetical protein GCM10025866_17050 [Naasia aerilata]
MTSRTPPAFAAGLVILLAGAALTACTGASGEAPAAASSGTAVLPDSATQRLLANVPSRAVAPTPEMRLAEGLLPPTNRWFSGLVFGAEPQPVFPFPLSFAQTASGFTAGLPTPAPSANTILGAVGPGLDVDLGATSALVSAYDEVSVTVEHRSGDTVLGHTTIAEGSPLVSYRADTAQTVRLSAPVTATGDGSGTVRVGSQEWVLSTTSGTVSGTSVDLSEGGSLVLLPLPEGTTDAQREALTSAAGSPLTAVTTSYRRTGDAQRTRLTYRTQAGGASLVVPLPHQGAAAAKGCSGLTYSTVYGTVPLCAARTLSFDTPTVPPASALDLSGLPEDEKAELGQQLKVDVSTSPTFAADTYFGGKTLYRAAMLLQLARELGDTESAATLTTALTDQLDKWTDPAGCTTRDQECFVYDPDLKTMVGLATSFGSEEGNDHHFHYGYFLYAAGVVAQDDPKLAKRWAPVLDLLAADIASRPGKGTSTAFPTTRVFDPYFSHSWASGYSPSRTGTTRNLPPRP